MPAFTIVTTSATQGSEEAEISTLSDAFTNESEALGYSRRMAAEMVSLAHQLSVDFDYSHVGLYDGDLIEVELDTDHPALLGVWILNEDAASYVSADEFREGAAEVEPA